MTVHSIAIMRCIGLRIEGHHPDNENSISLEITHGGDQHWDGERKVWVRDNSSTRIDLFGLPEKVTTALMEALADDDTTVGKAAHAVAPDDLPF